jgi:maleate isomerase
MDIDQVVGLIVPPSNPTLEVEIKALFDDCPYVYTSRLPFCSDKTLEERNEVYLESCVDTAQRFGTLPLKGILVGCTGSNYRLGPVEDRRRCHEASIELGTPLISGSLAVLEMIQELAFTKVQLELPYPDWLVSLAVSYWEEAGLEVVVQHSLLKPIDAESAYQIQSGALENYLSSLVVPSDTLVLLSGTGMPTIGAISEMVQNFQAPLLSSNLCAAHWMLSRCEEAHGSILYNQLMGKLKSFSAVKDGGITDNLFNPFG